MVYEFLALCALRETLCVRCAPGKMEHKVHQDTLRTQRELDLK
jgi:hypothetical protein